MRPESPKATVLISTYNRPDYLREAIASVVDQSMTDWELLIMNDGGIDVGHVIKEFSDPRIVYFDDTENKGAAHRFNFGLVQSRGDYITYLGDDDLFYPNHLEVLSRALDENPDYGLAYSDLYAVSCLKDEATGKRYVLDKRIQVSRDFNRNFMFHYNHVLHVSLMHRREAAFRVGGFDESIKVLIEWSLNRRLCFIYDFLHVPVVTGEYFMPIFKSDRISVVQRKDKNSYKHNLRKIRTNNPPKPWPKIDKIDLIYPVRSWDDKLEEMINGLVDNIDHPFNLILVNNGTGMSHDQCRAAIGKAADFRNIIIKHSRMKLPELDAYRYGAKQSGADYIFLISDNLKVDAFPKRIFGGLEYFKTSDAEALKWDIEEEKKSSFDILLKRETFLKRSNQEGKNNSVTLRHLKQVVASGFVFDAAFAEYKRLHSKGKFEEAYELIKNCLTIEKGAPGTQFLIDSLLKSCLAVKDYETAEKEIRSLIARGFEADNWMRLGVVLQARKKPKEAIEAYQKGLAGYGLNESDFESNAFPINFPKELAAFTTLIGIGECYFEMGAGGEAARYFHMAANLRANSHKPFLGFAKLYMAINQLDRAEVAISKIGPRDGKNDPETHRVLGKLCQRRGRVDLAFNCYSEAFKVDKNDEMNIDPYYYTGASLGKWQEMAPVLEEFLENHPHHVLAMSRLSSVYYQTGDYEKARELTERGLKNDPTNAVLKSISNRLKEMSDRKNLFELNAIEGSKPLEPESPLMIVGGVEQ